MSRTEIAKTGDYMNTMLRGLREISISEMRTPLEILEGMQSYFENEEAWLQGEFAHFNEAEERPDQLCIGAACISEAVNRDTERLAAPRKLVLPILRLIHASLPDAFKKADVEELKALYSDPNKQKSAVNEEYTALARDIAAFNDDPSTTIAEVRAVISSAISLSKAS